MSDMAHVREGGTEEDGDERGDEKRKRTRRDGIYWEGVEREPKWEGERRRPLQYKKRGMSHRPIASIRCQRVCQWPSPAWYLFNTHSVSGSSSSHLLAHLSHPRPSDHTSTLPRLAIA